MRRQKYDNYPTKHHIIPRSRGGRERDVVVVRNREHQYYHALFENKTPVEIVRYLNHVFWGDRYKGLEIQIDNFK